MFDLSLGELALIALACAVFIGPKELPVVIRTVLRLFHQMSDLAGELRRGFADIAKEAGVVDLKEEMEGTKRYIRDLDGQWREAYDVTELKSVMELPVSEAAESKPIELLEKP